MSETMTPPTAPSPAAAGEAASPPQPPPPKPVVPLHQRYALPAPIRTFPLPSFYPSNPLSLLHLLGAWLKQAVFPPPPEPSVVHRGVWDPATRSVHVVDPASMRALWEQGFYGKGSLSRSEPNWLKREKIRRGVVAGSVSEELTASRREARKMAKWERARLEQEAIERVRQEEARAAAAAAAAASSSSSSSSSTTQQTSDEPSSGEAATNGLHPRSSVETSPREAPTAALPEPLPLKSSLKSRTVAEQLPATEGSVSTETWDRPVHGGGRRRAIRPPVGPLELLALPNSAADAQGRWTGGDLVRCDQAPDTSHKISRHGPAAPPVGPLELLRLPNSWADLRSRQVQVAPDVQVNGHAPATRANGDRSNRLADGSSPAGARREASALTTPARLAESPQTNGDAAPHTHAVGDLGSPRDEPSRAPPPSSTGDLPQAVSPPDAEPSRPLRKRAKSVRFSPDVESNTFQHCDPPRPHHASAAREEGVVQEAKEPVADGPLPNGFSLAPPPARTAAASSTKDGAAAADAHVEIKDKEHLQLSPEEAFFLVFALGALSVVDPHTGAPIAPDRLLTLFRSYSYLPPLAPDAPSLSPSPSATLSPSPALHPHDPFLVHYVVYHHFRSLGWVPRHGVKFGVDWLLYQRGPVFDHAEFGLLVLPSFSAPWWKKEEERRRAPLAPRVSWQWLHGVNRVLSHVLKSLVLVYVDVPPPPVFEAAMAGRDGGGGGIAAALKQYRVREMMIRRWSSNRNR